jgi:rubrerythrin
MDILGAFDYLEEIERSIEAMYLSFSQAFSSDIESAALFREMAEDENEHLAIVQYQRRIILKNKQSFIDVEIDLGEIAEVIEKAKNGAKMSKDLSLDEALKISIDVERSSAEHHYKTIMSKANPAFSEMVNHLGSADEMHKGRLEKFLGERYFNTKDLLD